MTLYHYVGPKDLLELVHNDVARVSVTNSNDVQIWAKKTEQYLYDNSVTATYIVDAKGIMWISDRHMEHIVCAIGQPVLAAGEITFKFNTQSVEVTYITNQSTGFCPQPESWKIVKCALEKTNIKYPNQYSVIFIFRLCADCKTINIVKEDDYTCAVCGNTLN